MLAYWVNIQRHNELYPTKAIVQECWEHNKSNFRSFGWIGDAKARKACLHNIQYCPTVPYSEIPPWKFIMPLIDLQLQEEIKRKSKLMPVWCI